MSFTVLKTENMNIHKIWTNWLNAFVDLSKWTNELADPKKQDNSQASIDKEQVNLKVYSRVDLSDYLLLTLQAKIIYPRNFPPWKRWWSQKLIKKLS